MLFHDNISLIRAENCIRLFTSDRGRLHQIMRSWWPQQMVFTFRHLSRVNNWLGFFPILFYRTEKLVSICKQSDMYLYMNRSSHNLLLGTSLIWSLCIEQLVFSTLKIKKLGNIVKKYLWFGVFTFLSKYQSWSIWLWNTLEDRYFFFLTIFFCFIVG